MSGYDTNYGAFGELIREGQKGDFNSHITQETQSQLAGTVLF